MKLQIIKLVSIFTLSILAISCASSDQEKAEETKPIESHPKTVSHGTAEISGTIVKIKEHNGEKIIVIKVDAVLGYGAGTRPIPSGVELEFNVNESVDEQFLKENSNHNFTVRYMNERFGGEVKYPWKIIQINRSL